MKKTGSDQKKTHKSSIHLWFWIPLAIVGTLAIGGVFLCRYTPRAYRPLHPVDRQEVSPYLTHQLGPDFYNQVQLDEPFELRVEQDGLNDIISRWPWPQEYGPITFSDPMIVFGDNAIFLMGTLEYKKVSSVLTMIAFPTMDENGQLCLNIRSVRLGVLPITKVAGAIADEAFQASREYFEGEPQLEQVVAGMVSNQPFDPVFQFSDQKARIKDFTLEKGLLIIQFEPEKADKEKKVQ